MAVTRNYQADPAGKLVASNAGDVLLSMDNPAMSYAIGASATTAPALSVLHRPINGGAGMTLEAGEHLYVFGQGVVAVTGQNSVSGFIGE